MAITKKINKNASIKQFTQADLFAQNSASGPFATLSGTETLSNKTFSDAVTLAEISTPITPGSGFGRIYFKTDGFLYQLNDSGIETRVGSGSGSGAFNYILNSDAEAGVLGWATYADAAGAAPVDGTGGSSNVTWTQSLINPLRGVGSFLLTKDAANRQGQGASYDFEIADADLAKPLTVSFEYTSSPGFISGSSATNLSDVVVYVYDVTNAQIIQPAPFVLTGGTGNNHKFSAQFQSNSDSNDYRLIFHVASTNATAWTLKIDDVNVGPQIRLYGAPINDWTPYTPTGSWSTNTSYAGRWRRVGDSMEVEAYVLTGGAPTSSNLIVNLPSGNAIDTAKLSNVSNIGILGEGVLRGPAGHYKANAYYADNTSIVVTYSGSRNAAMYATKNSGSHNAANQWQNVSSWNSASIDTTGGWSTAGVYTVGVAGKYIIVGKASFVGSGSPNRGNRGVRVLRNSSAIQGNAQLNAEGINSGSGATMTTVIDCNVGDTIQLQAWQTEGSLAYETAIDAATSLSISLVTGNELTKSNMTPAITVTQNLPFTWGAGNSAVIRFMVPILGWGSNVVMSQDASTRVVAAQYRNAATTALSAGIPQVIPFTTVLSDTHNASSGSGTSWVYTCPVAGYYRTSVMLQTQTVNWTSTDQFLATLLRNGSGVRTLGNTLFTNTASVVGALSGSQTVYCNAGDTLAVQVSSSANANLVNSNNFNILSIERLSGPATVAASELVVAKYYNMTVPITSSDTTLIFTSKVNDTHGAYNTSTGEYTVPSPGFYRVTMSIGASASITGSANTASIAAVKVNGVQTNIFAQFSRQIAGALTPYLGGSSVEYLLAGQKVIITATRSASDSANWTTSGSPNSWFSVEKLNGVN